MRNYAESLALVTRRTLGEFVPAGFLSLSWHLESLSNVRDADAEDARRATNYINNE